MNGKTRKWTRGAVAIVLGWLLTVIGAVWAASANFTTAKTQITANRTAVADHEQRLRSIETHLQQIAADVRWIRRAIEQQQP